jgi:hypothetical protein
MYGDWTSAHLRGWKDHINEHSVQPIQQFAYTTGKNSTDSALIIDAMDLLHQDRFDDFALVSSDSDFTRLAARLRESGARVFGFGERKTPKSFVNACDLFIYFDVLHVDEAAVIDTREITEGLPDGHKTLQAVSPPQRATTKELRAAIASGADDDGWAQLSVVGSTIQKQSPDFDARNWGYAKLGDLIEAVGLFKIDRFVGPSGHTNLRARVLPKK